MAIAARKIEGLDALAVLVDPAARVLLADPGYPANRHFVRMLDGEPVGVPVMK